MMAGGFWVNNRKSALWGALFLGGLDVLRAVLGWSAKKNFLQLATEHGI
jgi:hypothetical protein